MLVVRPFQETNSSQMDDFVSNTLLLPTLFVGVLPGLFR